MQTLGTERKSNQDQKNSINTRKIAITALMTALETVSTMFLTVPIPATTGYFNVGEAIIYFTALMFGPFAGAFVGGAGAGLVDLLLGYELFAPITFISKGLEGFITGSLYFWFCRKSKESCCIGNSFSSISIIARKIISCPP